jgi:hypothetical protein
VTLTDAVRLVIADTREQDPQTPMTDREALSLARMITMDDVQGAADPGDDPRIVDAYALVLSAPADAIAAVLATLA